MTAAELAARVRSSGATCNGRQLAVLAARHLAEAARLQSQADRMRQAAAWSEHDAVSCDLRGRRAAALGLGHQAVGQRAEADRLDQLAAAARAEAETVARGSL